MPLCARWRAVPLRAGRNGTTFGAPEEEAAAAAAAEAVAVTTMSGAHALSLLCSSPAPLDVVDGAVVAAAALDDDVAVPATAARLSPAATTAEEDVAVPETVT